MKKILLIVLSLALVLSFSGCLGAGGNKLEGISLSDASEVSGVTDDKYDNDLKGLEKYLIDLKYIPEKAVATEMMSAVIGAEKGDRYNYNIDSSSVYVELYEYDINNLNSDAKRVIGEIKETGSFHVFDSNSDQDVIAAELSYNGKYLLIYTGGDGNDDLKQRKSDFTKAVKEFHKG